MTIHFECDEGFEYGEVYKELITKDIHDKSRIRILDTLDWPDFFCGPEPDRKEGQDGHT